MEGPGFVWVATARRMRGSFQARNDLVDIDRHPLRTALHPARMIYARFTRI